MLHVSSDGAKLRNTHTGCETGGMVIRLREPGMQPPGSGTDSKDGHAGHSQSDDRFGRLCPKLGCNFGMLRHCALYAIPNPGSRDGDLECLAI